MPQFIPNERYLTDKEMQLQESISHNDCLYRTKFDACKTIVPGDKGKEKWEKWLQLAAKMPEMISKVSADFLFNELPEIESDTETGQEYIKENIWNMQFTNRLHPAAMISSSLGGVVLQVVSSDEQKSRLSFIYPQHFFPVVSQEDAGKLSEAYIIIKQDLMISGVKEKTIYVQHFIPGSIIREVWLTDKETGNKLKAQLPLESVFPNLKEVETLGFDTIPLFYVANFQKDLDFLGVSDYDGLESLFHALNRRLTQNEASLERFSEPKMIVGSGVLDHLGRPFSPSGNYYEVNKSPMDTSPVIPAFLQQKLSVQENLDTIGLYFNLICALSEIYPGLIGLDPNTNLPESGRAIRSKLLRTLTMASRKANNWILALTEAINLCLEIEGINGKVTRVRFKDGLPEDMRELIEDEALKLNAEIESQTDAIMRVDGIDKTAATEKALEINAGFAQKQTAINKGFVP